MVCPNCGHVNVATAKFCARCGQSLLSQFCPDCGADCALTASQCPNGHPLPLPAQRLLGKGMVLTGRYRIEKLLGCGGFGAVYLASDTRFQQRQVAVKENHDPSVSKSFLKEAEILANLHHPNLPRVSDFFEEPVPTIAQFRPYMVMDYIEGEELWERIQSQGKLSEQEVLDLLKGVFDALEYLHGLQQPIFHRDVKPQNIRIMPDRRTFLVDFGIAKLSGGMTTTGSRAATPPFAPPEQYRMAGETDERSDQYALAMTIYVALTGQVPTHAEATRREQAVTTGAPDPLEPLSKVAPDVSPRMAKAVMKSLSVSKQSRFSSIREFRQALYPPTIVGMTRLQFVSTVFATASVLTVLSLCGYQFWKWRQPLWLVAELKGHSGGVTSVAFTPDGDKVLSASHDKTIRVWDWRKGKCQKVLKRHNDSVRCLALLDHNRVASASWDGTVRISDWRTGKQLARFAANVGRLNALTVNSKGEWLVAGGEQGIFVRSEGGKADRILSKGIVRSLAFHPNGKVLAVGDSVGQIWLLNIVPSEPTARWQAHQGAVTALAFKPDGAILFSGSEDATLAVWDVVSRSLVKRIEGWHQREIRAVAFSPDGKFAVSCSMDDRLRVWQVEDWRLMLTKEGGRNWSLTLTFDPSGKFLASASKDETVKVWRVKFSATAGLNR